MGEKKGFFSRLVEGLTKTRNNIVSGIDSVFHGFSKIDDEFYEELEEILIMESGLRGYSVGGAKVSEKHCGFIINTGNATAEDVKDVIWEVQRRVKERFQVDLEPEIKFL